MPDLAYMNNKDGNPIPANKVAIHQKDNHFICCTEGCTARMILVKAGTDSAYYRSNRIIDHVSPWCVKNSIKFKPSDYDESRFDLNFAFESMLGLNHSIKEISRGGTGTRTGTVGGSKQLRIHTLPLLYSMCLNVGKNGYYNNCLIDDILSDDENYERYKNGINGFKIVEVSKYHKVQGEFAFIMNYPTYNRIKSSWVKIEFEDKELFWSQYNKLKESNHIEPIIIAGEWESVDNKEYHSKCVIHKKTQIYYVKEY